MEGRQGQVLQRRQQQQLIAMVGLVAVKGATVIAGHRRVVEEKEAKETGAVHVAVGNQGKSEAGQKRERDLIPAWEPLDVPVFPA